MSRLDVEIHSMMMLQHPNVVSLYEVMESDSFVYLVMEVCDGGTLLGVIGDYGEGLEESVARFYFEQLMEGLNYCHQQVRHLYPPAAFMAGVLSVEPTVI